MNMTRGNLLLTLLSVVLLSALTVAGCSDDESPASPNIDTAPPAIPDGVDGSVNGGLSVNLTWNANVSDPDLAGYVIYRSETPATGYVAVTATVTANGWTDETVVPGHSYYYRIASIDVNANISALSSPIHVLVPQAVDPRDSHLDG